MNTQALRFGSSGQTLRSEDPPLVTGQGRFTDDLNIPGQTHAVFVRASVAHAVIRSVDVSAAKAASGVLGVFTGADLAAAGLGSIPPIAVTNGRDGKPMAVAPIPVLATDRVRFAG